MSKKQDVNRSSTQIYIPAGIVNPNEDAVVEIPADYNKYSRLVARKMTKSVEFDAGFPSDSFPGFNSTFSLGNQYTERNPAVASSLAQAEELEKSVILSQLQEYQQFRRKLMMQSGKTNHHFQNLGLPSIVPFAPPPPPVLSSTCVPQLPATTCSTQNNTCEAATSPPLGVVLSVPPLPNTPISCTRPDSCSNCHSRNVLSCSQASGNTDTRVFGAHSNENCNTIRPKFSYEQRKISCPICESICGIKDYDLDVNSESFLLTDMDIKEIHNKVQESRKKLRNIIDNVSEKLRCYPNVTLSASPFSSDMLEKSSNECLICTENETPEDEFCFKRPDNPSCRDYALLQEQQIRNINQKMRESQQIFQRKAAELRATLQSVLKNRCYDAPFEPPCTSTKDNTDLVDCGPCQVDPVSSASSKKSILKQTDLVCPRCKMAFTEASFPRHKCTNTLLDPPASGKDVTVSAMVTVPNDPEVTFYNESFPVQSGSERSVLSNAFNSPYNGSSSSSVNSDKRKRRIVPSKHSRAIICVDKVCPKTFSGNTQKIDTKNAETFCHLQVTPAARSGRPKHKISEKVGTDSQCNASASTADRLKNNTPSEAERKERFAPRLRPDLDCNNPVCPKNTPREISCQCNLAPASRSAEPFRTTLTPSGTIRDSSCQFTATRFTKSAEPIYDTTPNHERLRDFSCQYTSTCGSRSARPVSFDNSNVPMHDMTPNHERLRDFSCQYRSTSSSRSAEPVCFDNLAVPKKLKTSSSQVGETPTSKSAEPVCDNVSCPEKLKKSIIPTYKSSESFCTAETCSDKFKDPWFCTIETCSEKYRDFSNQYDRQSSRSAKTSSDCSTGFKENKEESTLKSANSAQIKGGVASSPEINNVKPVCVNSTCPYRASGEISCNPGLCDPEYKTKNSAKSYHALLLLKRKRESK